MKQVQGLDRSSDPKGPHAKMSKPLGKTSTPLHGKSSFAHHYIRMPLLNFARCYSEKPTEKSRGGSFSHSSQKIKFGTFAQQILINVLFGIIYLADASYICSIYEWSDTASKWVTPLKGNGDLYLKSQRPGTISLVWIQCHSTQDKKRIELNEVAIQPNNSDRKHYVMLSARNDAIEGNETPVMKEYALKFANQAKAEEFIREYERTAQSPEHEDSELDPPPLPFDENAIGDEFHETYYYAGSSRRRRGHDYADSSNSNRVNENARRRFRENREEQERKYEKWLTRPVGGEAPDMRNNLREFGVDPDDDHHGKYRNGKLGKWHENVNKWRQECGCDEIDQREHKKEWRVYGKEKQNQNAQASRPDPLSYIVAQCGQECARYIQEFQEERWKDWEIAQLLMLVRGRLQMGTAKSNSPARADDYIAAVNRVYLRFVGEKYAPQGNVSDIRKFSKKHFDWNSFQAPILTFTVPTNPANALPDIEIYEGDRMRDRVSVYIAQNGIPQNQHQKLLNMLYNSCSNPEILDKVHW